jgi:8-oxo-dGTP diphosphatase
MTTVVAAVIESEGKILCCQRRRDASFPLMWEFPGGKVEPGESATAALARELKEELAIEALIGRELRRLQYRYAEHSSPIELIFFAASIRTGEPRNLQFETIEWRRREVLTNLDFLPADKEFVEKLAREENIL